MLFRASISQVEGQMNGWADGAQEAQHFVATVGQMCQQFGGSARMQRQKWFEFDRMLCLRQNTRHFHFIARAGSVNGIVEHLPCFVEGYH